VNPSQSAWLVAGVFSFLTVSPSSFAQGSLTPPGSPAPTMRSLDQIEARTPISSLPFTINTSGSFYLTKNLSVSSGDGITIATNQVTLDLNGFSISSSASSPSGSGIALSCTAVGGLKDVTILNGHIAGGFVSVPSPAFSGFANGISATCIAPPLGVRVAGVTVSDCSSSGINLGTGDVATVVESSLVYNSRGSGITGSLVSGSMATRCAGTAIVADTASNCRGVSTATSGSSNDGITANSSAFNCYGSTGASASKGISAPLAANCYGVNNSSGTGVFASRAAEHTFGLSNGGVAITGQTVVDSYGSTSGSGKGVDADIAQNCFGTTTGNGVGVNAFLAQNCDGAATNGTGIVASISIGCKASGVTPFNVAHQYFCGSGPAVYP
jgi:hypothetical protein